MPNVRAIRKVPERDTTFGADVRGRSWHWLFELCRRIGVELQLVDTRSAVVIPAGFESETSALGMLLNAAPPALMAAIRETVTLQQPQFVSVDLHRIVCVPLVVDDVVRGVSVITRVAGASATDVNADAFRSQLEVIGTRLARAIETHLEQPPDIADADFERIVTFARVLAEADHSGSERELLVAFVRALSMWHEVECRIYLEDPAGLLTLDVSLPGVTWGPAEAMVPLTSWVDSTLVSLTHGEMEQIGLPTDRDVVIARVPRPNGARIAVMRGRLPQRDISRIAVYLSLLDQRLQHARTDRALAALQHLVTLCGTEGLTANDVARHLLEGLIAGTGGVAASLDVDDADGTPLLRVSAGDSSRAPDDAAGAVAVSRASGHHRLTLKVALRSDAALGPAAQAFVGAVADLLVLWERFTGRSSDRVERRMTHESHDASFERLARQALEHGEDITAVVVRVRDQSPVGVALEWIAQWRAQVRPADSVALLTTGEIGILLRGSSSSASESVVDRLMEAAHIDRAARRVSVGMSSHSASARLPERVLPFTRTNA